MKRCGYKMKKNMNKTLIIIILSLACFKANAQLCEIHGKRDALEIFLQGFIENVDSICLKKAILLIDGGSFTKEELLLSSAMDSLCKENQMSSELWVTRKIYSNRKNLLKRLDEQDQLLKDMLKDLEEMEKDLKKME